MLTISIIFVLHSGRLRSHPQIWDLVVNACQQQNALAYYRVLLLWYTWKKSFLILQKLKKLSLRYNTHQNDNQMNGTRQNGTQH
jgi:hypothetical protein